MKQSPGRFSHPASPGAPGGVELKHKPTSAPSTLTEFGESLNLGNLQTLHLGDTVLP